MAFAKHLHDVILQNFVIPEIKAVTALHWLGICLGNPLGMRIKTAKTQFVAPYEQFENKELQSTYCFSRTFLS